MLLQMLLKFEAAQTDMLGRTDGSKFFDCINWSFMRRMMMEGRAAQNFVFEHTEGS